MSLDTLHPSIYLNFIYKYTDFFRRARLVHLFNLVSSYGSYMPLSRARSHFICLAINAFMAQTTGFGYEDCHLNFSYNWEEYRCQRYANKNCLHSGFAKLSAAADLWRWSLGERTMTKSLNTLYNRSL